MSNCCICQAVRSVRNIFEEHIGKSPPVMIGNIVQELVKETPHKFNAASGICRKCCDKVLRWHDAILVAQQTQRELLQLLDNAGKANHSQIKSADEANRLDVESSKIDHLSVSKAEIKLECDSIYNADPIECSEQETDMEEIMPSTPLCEFLDSNMVANNFEFVLEKTELEKDSKDIDRNNRHVEVFNDASNDNGNDEDDLEEPNQTRTKKTKNVKRIRSEEKTKRSKNIVFTKEKTKKVAANVNLKCAECDQTFKSQRQYSAHVRKEHSTGFICDQCGKTLQSYPGLTKHILNHNPVKPFKCSECGKGFHQQGNLKRHIAEHENSGENIHKCDVCSRRFYYLNDLQRHQIWHDDRTRRIACDVCGSKFRTQPHLNRHMATHTGAKPHRCPVCGKCFAQLYNMRVHHREHEQPGSTRQRRLKCDNCSRTFTNREKYQVHCERAECEASAAL